MLGFVGRDGLFKLLLADIAPGTHSVADYLDVELGHGAERWPEHIQSLKEWIDLQWCSSADDVRV
jgi:hypothetical protein